jgi:hypothetical protein
MCVPCGVTISFTAAPSLLGHLSSTPTGSLWFNSPWVIAGALKCIYDVVLYGLYLKDNTMRTGEERLLKESTASVQDAGKTDKP